MRFAASLTVVVLSVGLSGCWFGKKKTPNVPVILPSPTPPPPAPETPPPREPPQSAPTQSAPESPSPSAPAPKKPLEKPSPSPKKTEPPKTEELAPAPQANAPAAPAPNPPPMPRLGEILSDQTRAQYEAEFAQRISRARAALAHAARRALSKQQSETAERIRSFIRQADESKPRDIATALQLARRADLLGQDLLSSLQ